MNDGSPELLQQLNVAADAADRMARAGDFGAAMREYQKILERAPWHSRACNFLAMHEFTNGNMDAALVWSARAVFGAPKMALIVANRGLILGQAGQIPEAISAYREALTLDERFLPARLDLGVLLEHNDQLDEACVEYQKALQQIPSGQALPAPLLARAQAAQAAIQRHAQLLEMAVEQRLRALREAHSTKEIERFEECLDIVQGKKKVQISKPGFMCFPKLPALTFYPREMFPWTNALEKQTDAIREELLRAMQAEDEDFMPYVQKSISDAPAGSVWSPLNHNPNWGVYFLYNQGERVGRHAQQCPITMAALDALPMVNIANRGPTAFFSRLKPGTHIPPHHGATNTRLICHLPLIVPDKCAIRVGNDVRTWEVGKTLIFDDTLEHEAWNQSGETRVVLIFDVWNPYLTELEREAVRITTETYAEYHPEKLHYAD